MKTIKGKITQIVCPDKIDNLVISWNKTKYKIIKDKYLLVIKNPDINIPKNLLRRLLWYITPIENLYYYVVMSHCNYKVGDIIETTIEPIMIESGFYTNE